MKIYTKTGDDGSTGLIGGQRIRKSDRRIECFGTIDELNASLGCAGVVAGDALLGSLREIQNDLFVIGSHLALPEHDELLESCPTYRQLYERQLIGV